MYIHNAWADKCKFTRQQKFAGTEEHQNLSYAGLSLWLKHAFLCPSDTKKVFVFFLYTTSIVTILRLKSADFYFVHILQYV